MSRNSLAMCLMVSCPMLSYGIIVPISCVLSLCLVSHNVASHNILHLVSHINCHNVAHDICSSFNFLAMTLHSTPELLFGTSFCPMSSSCMELSILTPPGSSCALLTSSFSREGVGFFGVVVSL